MECSPACCKFIEKVPDATVKRLLDILKIVCVAEHEPQSVPKDAKAPLMLFKYTDARFNWGSLVDGMDGR